MKIKIDEYHSYDISLPDKISFFEFKELIEQYNKLIEVWNGGLSDGFREVIRKTEKRTRRNKRPSVSREEAIEIIKEYNHGDRQGLVQKYNGDSKKGLSGWVWYLRNKKFKDITDREIGEKEPIELEGER